VILLCFCAVARQGACAGDPKRADVLIAGCTVLCALGFDLLLPGSCICDTALHWTQSTLTFMMNAHSENESVCVELVQSGVVTLLCACARGRPVFCALVDHIFACCDGAVGSGRRFVGER
jgi:hypothetical protein